MKKQSEIPQVNQEGANQASEGQQQPTVEIHPACGQNVQGNVKLISNLICKSDGLIVGANNTTHRYEWILAERSRIKQQQGRNNDRGPA